MFLRILFTTLSCILFSALAYAGSSGIAINCKSASGRTLIYGSVTRDSEEYNLKIKVDNAIQHFQYVCQDPGCKQMIHIGNLYVVEALSKKVFVIVLANKSGAFLGRIYAIPATVKYNPGPNKFTASLKAIYYGMDPRTMNNYLKHPIHLTCRLKYEI